ncbi:MAG TPA: demethoxyubiquinone hydroxylase family protein [Caulobacteraceae bacterium]|jgi:ubiquinone biosynthesis monooxygenase Coq7|nr:demethoxyubiquinone hydroxylase family protein [Caulobacteraceae bacterium]
MSERPLPPRPGPGAGAARLAEILRVDHAGELAAVHIYRGHRAVFEAAGMTEAVERMRVFEAHEAVHLARFDALLTQEQVRPTLMAPVWRAAAFGLGVGAALISEKTAHACTEAVETVIEEHYQRQIAEVGAREPALAAELAAFRDDETAHRAQAIELGAAEAPLHGLFGLIVRTGCKLAIKISERV